MNILVLVENYPSEDNIYAMSYVHSRNIEYVARGHKVDVVSFKAKNQYEFENISVFNEKSYKGFKNINIIISHAPNIKNHLRFLIFKGRKKPLVLFFHGHEIMNTLRYYPKDYSFNGTPRLKRFIRKRYDSIKLKILKRYLINIVQKRKVSFIFVSGWMKDIAFKSLFLNSKEVDIIDKYSCVINNGVNNVFLERSYTQADKVEADFITIRPLDNSKYGVDIVYRIAKYNPEYSFHIYGKGEFFDHVEKLENLKVFNYYIHQKNIPSHLNKYKYALMPTRLDAQGVMMCEIATYKMPLITSNIPICTEMIGGFPNVSFISNNLDSVKIGELIPSCGQEKINKFDIKELVKKEEMIYIKLISK